MRPPDQPPVGAVAGPEPIDRAGSTGSGSSPDSPSDTPETPEQAEPEATGAAPSPRRSRSTITAGRSRSLTQVLAFIRTEALAVLRQPRLLGVLVIGPFLILFLFGVGYDQTETVLRTAFVGPEGSVFEDAVEQFGSDLEEYVEDVAYTSDLIEAEQWLADDEIDLLVIFPPDPAETVLGGEQAIIDVLHDKLDPIQQTAVNISAQVAVQELNAAVLEQAVGEAQRSIESYQDTAEQSADVLEQLDRVAAGADQGEVDRLASELQQTSSELRTAIEVTDSIRTTLGGTLDPTEQERLDLLVASVERYQASTEQLATGADDLNPDDIRAAREALDEIIELGETVSTIDPAVAVRPFRTDAENLLRLSVTLNDFFAPGAIALLVQHMALTFAALGLVRDRRLGLFELYRVGPIRAGWILVGKYLAYLLLGGLVAGALLAAVHYLVGVPFRGAWWWGGIGIVGLVTASVAAGLLLALLARTDSQAVQYAMLALLAGLFFGGFVLELDAIRYPVKAVSFALPVTYGTNLLRDVMLRGSDPATLDLIGLVATAVGYGALAWLLMARRLRTGST